MEGRAASIIKLVCINVVYSVWPLPSIYIHQLIYPGRDFTAHPRIVEYKSTRVPLSKE